MLLGAAMEPRSVAGRVEVEGAVSCNLPGIITLCSLSEQEQYHFCYDIALEYLESLESR